MNESIAKLNSAGQSLWYDNLSRGLLNTGELGRIIASGVSGLTSNPTIFKKAVAEGSDYDAWLKGVSSEDVEEVCEELMIADVGAAADLLLPRYKASGGQDGYASIEVSPLLARDSDLTLTAARRISKKLGRPNIMIKIPGTSECLDAIQSALEEGINVNVTLLFSTRQYEAVIERYLAALETRLKRKESVTGITSVASFFVSRVDAIFEETLAALQQSGQLQALQGRELYGKVAVANARLAYGLYEKYFSSERFSRLKAAGAKTQRPLWASTGTKNKELPPLIYVEELVLPDTVNTVPPATLDLVLKGVRVRPPADLEAARKTVALLPELGIDLNELLMKLQDDGVVLFAQSYHGILAALEEKKRDLGDQR